MSKYTNKITLTKNDRGVWDLDPFKGCEFGISSNYTTKDFSLFEHKYNKNNGCYGICYANKIANFRGYDFGKTIKRDFADEKHFKSIAKKLQNIPFIRLGVSCDPSSDWEHTLSIVNKIRPHIKNIVIITKHWNHLKEEQLPLLKGICVNTSISALDNEHDIEERLYWYYRLKGFCKSVLRVNTAKFNDRKLEKLQEELLNSENVIDNELRINKNHELARNGIIEVKKYKFLNSYTYASKHNPKTFFGYCKNCPDQCGITL